MLIGERACRASILVAWLGIWFSSHTQARPKLSPGPFVPPFAGPFANTSLSPVPAAGGCGKCGIEAPGGIRLVYWEPESAAKNGSNITLAQNNAQAYTQVDNGFTYTSPSVYVIYSSLRATATCSDDALHTIGPSFSEKTIAYSSRFLAYGTLSMPDAGCSEFVVVDGFHTIDFSSLYYNPITTTTTYKAGCAPYVNPRLSLPAELTNVDPSWQSCEPLFYGAFDPPSVITKVSGGLAPSPVGAGQVTSAASAQALPDDASMAQPVVTPAPPVVAPTNNAPTQNTILPAPPPPASPAAPTVNPAPAGLPSANPPVANPPIANSPVANSPIANSPVANPPIANPPVANPPIASPTSSPPSLGNLINRPFTSNTNNGVASPASGANPAAVAADPDKSAASSTLVAIPVDTGDGKSAYAVVAAEPSPGKGLSSEGIGNVGALGPSNSPAVTTKVTLSDGTTADIPTADIIEPAQPQGGNVAAGISTSNFQTVHLDAGAFVAVPGPSGSLSSVQVQGGDYLLLKPTAGAAMQTLTLQDGQLTTVPLDQSQSVTLQDGQVTKIAMNAPAQVVTLQNGGISTVLPIPQTTATLANGQVTTLPVATLTVGSGGDNSDVPKQILTLSGDKMTTVPIDTPDQTATLQGGKVTTIPADAPPQIVTLANGQVSTISSNPHTTVTLADGKVTAIPVSSDTGLDAENQSGFIDVPDATISGKVHYTHLPIIKIQNSTISNNTGNHGASRSAAQSGLSSLSPSSQTTIPTTTSLANVATSAANTTSTNTTTTSNKTSSGNQLSLEPKLHWGIFPASASAFVYFMIFL